MVNFKMATTRLSICLARCDLSQTKSFVFNKILVSLSLNISAVVHLKFYRLGISGAQVHVMTFKHNWLTQLNLRISASHFKIGIFSVITQPSIPDKLAFSPFWSMFYTFAADTRNCSWDTGMKAIYIFCCIFMLWFAILFPALVVLATNLLRVDTYLWFHNILV